MPGTSRGVLFSPLLAPFVSRGTVLVGLAAVGLAFGLMEALRFTCTSVSAGMSQHIPILRAEEQHRPTGSTFFIAGALLAFLFFDSAIAANATLIQAVADPAAAIVGTRWGHHRWRGKSLEGSLAYLTTAIAAGCLLLPSHLGLGLPLLALGAVAATVLEFLPLPIDDNLRVPLLTSLVLAAVRAFL